MKEETKVMIFLSPVLLFFIALTVFVFTMTLIGGLIMVFILLWFAGWVYHFHKKGQTGGSGKK